MVHPVKRSAAIASADQPVAAARLIPMRAMIGDAAVLGKTAERASVAGSGLLPSIDPGEPGGSLC